jgi:hypothetical protein
MPERGARCVGEMTLEDESLRLEFASPPTTRRFRSGWSIDAVWTTPWRSIVTVSSLDRLWDLRLIRLPSTHRKEDTS